MADKIWSSVRLKPKKDRLCQTFFRAQNLFVSESSIYGGIFDVPAKKERLATLEAHMGASSFWDDAETAKAVIQEANDLKSWTEPLESLLKRVEDVQSLAPEAEQDPAFVNDLSTEISRIDSDLTEVEVRRMLSGEMDASSCFLSINAGAGGTEACDWANMLLRMYERWASRRGWKVEVVEVLPGEVAGIRNVTIHIEGPFAYGYAKAEKGVHRLVRISPFDANARRHTSFAAVDVTPEVTEAVSIEIRPEDLKIDTYRASGAGGQHVNKTDSAVRIQHIPTGIIVSSQSQRSQIQNREYCLKLLKSKLYEREMEERRKKLEEMAGEKRDIAWGSQIRSYVFQPYTLVKDTRTKYEIGDVQSVMDGNIDPFIQAFLKEFGGKIL
jgi:peptide chain release factor 2